jgi:hypothetical protein
MTEKTTAPTAQFPQMDHVKKLVEDQSVRVGQLFEEAAKAHTTWIEFGNTQIDGMNELLKTQFNSLNEIAASWRQLSLEGFRKAAASFKF